MKSREFSIFITFPDTYTCSYVILCSSSRASSPEVQNVSLIDDSVIDNNGLGVATSDCKIITL